MGIPRLVIAGTQSGVGKTTVSMGLMKALVDRGMNLQPFKVGPDYIDPAFHTYVTKNKSRNLDSWMVSEQGIKELFQKSTNDKEIAIIEGVMGLYDGFSTERDMGSTAHVSKIINAPVLLIINGSGMSSSAAAQVLGYKHYDPDVNLAGVIINKVSSKVHYDLLKEAIERDTGIPCYGYLQKDLDINLDSRHLGLIPSCEVENLDNKIKKIGRMIEETLDVDGIIELGCNAPKLDRIKILPAKPLGDVNIGVPRDNAFNFYYEDNLDYLKELGATLKYFSPLEDNALPNNIDGLYIGGGFPEVFRNELSENKDMLSDIKQKSQLGMPIYAECGGLMYLSNKIVDLDGNQSKMVGIFDVDARMTKRLQRFGYVYVEMACDSILGKGIKTKGHEFHRSMVEGNDEDKTSYKVLKARKNVKNREWRCGLTKDNTLGAYPHIHFYSNKEIAQNFVGQCVKFKEGVGKNG